MLNRTLTKWLGPLLPAIHPKQRLELRSIAQASLNKKPCLVFGHYCMRRLFILGTPIDTRDWCNIQACCYDNLFREEKQETGGQEIMTGGQEF